MSSTNEKTEKKKSVWTCKHGCRVSAIPCPHLEALLPKDSRQQLKDVQYEINDKSPGVLGISIYELIPDSLDESSVRNKLKQLVTLTDEETEIFVERVVYGRYYKEIAEAMSLSINKCFRTYKDVVAKIERAVK